MKKTANKCGLRFSFYDYVTQEPALYVDFINDYSEELSADRTFATGDWNGANLVGFDDPITGTVRLSTQIIPIELLAMAAGGNVASGAQLAHREVVVAGAEGAIAVKNTPIAGTVYVYKIDEDCSGKSLEATVTDKNISVTGATKDDKYVVYYLEDSADAKKVEFKSDLTNKFYTLRGYTKYKDTDGLDSLEHVVGYKLQPKKNFSITYHGKGDPVSWDMEFDILEDAEGRTYEHIRV